MIKESILVLIVLAGIVSCDDIIFPDGKTLAEGYVIDSLTNQKVPNVSVHLAECNIGWLGRRCKGILDSTRTNADGYYRFRFKDKRKTDFGVGLAYSPESNFLALPLAESHNNGQYVIDDNQYLVEEGKKNRFVFLCEAVYNHFCSSKTAQYGLSECVSQLQQPPVLLLLWTC